MKKANDNFTGRRGSIPPQLFKYMDTADMAAETARFTKYIDGIATDFVRQVRARTVSAGAANVNLVAPPLFGQDVTLEYVGGGTMGGVYKMNIGDEVFALKINFIAGTNIDLIAMSEYKRARNLINKPYIGATFSADGKSFSWMLSDYVADDYEDSYIVAKEKLFYAALTKGLKYSDVHAANTKNGKIVDIAGIYHRSLNLTRVETDMVKKFLHLMRTNDMPAFKRLGDMAVARFPNVISYLFVKMNIYQMEMPCRFAPFKREIAKYNNAVRAAFAEKSPAR